MELINYLALVVAWILGAVYGWYARERYARRIIERLVSHMSEIAPEMPRIHIIIERRHGMFYAYDKETNEFMAQGSDQKELETNLANRYPNMLFAVDRETLNDLNGPT